MNWRKLLLEIAIVAAVVLVVVAIRVLPDIIDQPVLSRNNQYKYYYHLALEYDYSKGPNAELEKKLVEAADNGKINHDHLYYNKAALAEYYSKTGRCIKAIPIFLYAKDLAREPQQYKYVWGRLANCHAALGQTEEQQDALNYYDSYKNYPDDV